MPTRAIVIFPHPRDLAEINRLRARFDPLARVIAPHITLVFPYNTDAGRIDLRTHVERAISDVPSFIIRLAGVTGGGDKGQYLFLNVEQGSRGVIELHDRLYSGSLAHHLSLEHPYVPHLTLGRVKDPAAFPEALAEASSSDVKLTVDVAEVALVRTDGWNRWRTELTVGLRS
jgi:2'-5' RNA ligase